MASWLENFLQAPAKTVSDSWADAKSSATDFINDPLYATGQGIQHKVDMLSNDPIAQAAAIAAAMYIGGPAFAANAGVEAGAASLGAAEAGTIGTAGAAEAGAVGAAEASPWQSLMSTLGSGWGDSAAQYQLTQPGAASGIGLGGGLPSGAGLPTATAAPSMWATAKPWLQGSVGVMQGLSGLQQMQYGRQQMDQQGWQNDQQRMYAQQIQDLMANPNSVMGLPGYGVGAENVQRQMRAGGFNGSSAMSGAMDKYSETMFQNQMNNLINLQRLASGGGATTGQNIFNQGATSFGAGLGALLAL